MAQASGGSHAPGGIEPPRRAFHAADAIIFQEVEDMPIASKLIAAAGLAALVVLGGCSGSMAPGLSSGLTARMDQPGASLDRADALGILNAYRSTQGVAALAPDAGLDATAQTLAADYARSGQPPRAPAGSVGIRVSAGYSNFAETFSGWRNSPEDARAIANPAARRGGLGVAYDVNSTYGVYWVLVLDD